MNSQLNSTANSEPTPPHSTTSISTTPILTATPSYLDFEFVTIPFTLFTTTQTFISDMIYDQDADDFSGDGGGRSSEHYEDVDMVGPTFAATPEEPSEISSTLHSILNRDPEQSYVKTRYHPFSDRAPMVEQLRDYGVRAQVEYERDPKPWQPFRTRIDFEISELALEAALSEKQIQRLTTLIHRAVEKKNEEDTFTVKNAADMKGLWELSSEKCTPVINFAYKTI